MLGSGVRAALVRVDELQVRHVGCLAVCRHCGILDFRP